jgi:hypothetical protein
LMDKIKSMKNQNQNQDKDQQQVQKETCEQMILRLMGKRVLFIDLETTGFPIQTDQSMPGGYADYRSNDQYEGSRILQIGYYYSDNFSPQIELNEIIIEDVRSVIRKPLNFKQIHPKAIEIHGITYQRAMEQGVSFAQIVNGEFGNHLMECDYIVAYNAYFDFSILCNEIHRIKKMEMYQKLLGLKDQNVFSVMRLCESYRGSQHSLEIMYKFLLNENISSLSQTHDAKNDVYAMVKILEYVSRNPICPKDSEELQKLREQYVELKKRMCEIEAMHKNTSQLIHSVRERLEHVEKSTSIRTIIKKNEVIAKSGSLWDAREEEQLTELYVNKQMSIGSIALIHKRSGAGIIARLKKMNILREHDDPSFQYIQQQQQFRQKMNNNQGHQDHQDRDQENKENMIPAKNLFRLVKKNNEKHQQIDNTIQHNSNHSM